MPDRTPLNPTGPAHNRGVGPPSGRRTFARAATAQSAMGVSPSGGHLVPGNAPTRSVGVMSPATRPTRALGPPWILAYVLLNARSYDLNEHFQLSVRELDRASGTRLHFQDIGNPRIRGEIYERIASPELLNQDEMEADLYLQEMTRLGGEWPLRLKQTEELAMLLGLNLESLPCVAFRTAPFDGVVILEAKSSWYETKPTRWAFFDALKAWLSEELDWLDGGAFTTVELRETLSVKLSVLSNRIDDVIPRVVQGTPATACDLGQGVFVQEGDAWRIMYEGTETICADCLGLHYVRILLQNPGRWLPALTLLNAVRTAGAEVLSLGTDDVVDEKALGQYRLELAALTDKIKSAADQDDFETAKRLDEERTRLIRHLQRSKGRSGHIRQFGDEDEWARQSVTKAIKRSLEPFSTRHPALHAHLENSLKYGREICYQPETAIRWDL